MSLTIEDVARICHETNRAYCAALGDDSQPPWEDAPDWQRTSATNGVMARMGDPTLPASSSHDAWTKEKLEAGWGWGPVKDPAKKEHPCLVPFDELPLDQQAKDHLFVGVVDALRSMLGKAVACD